MYKNAMYKIVQKCEFKITRSASTNLAPISYMKCEFKSLVQQAQILAISSMHFHVQQNWVGLQHMSKAVAHYAVCTIKTCKKH